MLRSEGIKKSYLNGKKIALSALDLHIPKGSIYGLLGPNGAGKTTFIRIINQIIPPDEGKIYIENQLLNLSHTHCVGYMPEERGLYKNMNLEDQILYFARLKGMDRQQARAQAKWWFQRLEMEFWGKKKLSELSKGMAQKVQFVVTVLHDPKLLILDEPFSGFDPVNANLIRDCILELRERGTTIILSTHRMESVEELCDRVALIHQSKKVLDGEIWALKNQFRSGNFRATLSEVELDKIHLINDLDLIHKEERHQRYYLEIKLEKGEKANDLAQKLQQIGQLYAFEERLPSMNEIFLRSVH